MIIPTVVALYQEAAPTRFLDSLVRETSQKRSVTILVDSTASGAKVAEPSATDLEAWLSELVKNIPGGASWVKFWLPPPPRGKRWTGEDVAAYALSLSKLYGRVGAVEVERDLWRAHSRNPREPCHRHLSPERGRDRGDPDRR